MFEHKESDLPNVQTYKYSVSNNPLKVFTDWLLVGLGWSNNSESWAGGTVATGTPTMM